MLGGEGFPAFVTPRKGVSLTLRVATAPQKSEVPSPSVRLTRTHPQSYGHRLCIYKEVK